MASGVFHKPFLLSRPPVPPTRHLTTWRAISIPLIQMADMSPLGQRKENVELAAPPRLLPRTKASGPTLTEVQYPPSHAQVPARRVNHQQHREVQADLALPIL